MIKMVKKLLESVREFKKASIITPIFMALEVSFECFLPYIMSLLITYIGSFEKGGNLTIADTTIWLYVGLLLICTFCSFASGVCSARFGAIASTGFARNLREDIFAKIQTFSFENIDHFSSSSLVTRLTTDVTNVQQSYQMCLRIAVRTPLMFIFSIIMSFLVGGNLAWIFVIILPFVALSIFILIKKALPIFKRLFIKYDSLNESVEENVSAIRVVKSYVREDYEQNKFNTASQNLKKEFVFAEKLLALNNPIMYFFTSLGTALVSYFCAIVIVESNGASTDVATLQALIQYGNQMLFAIMMLSMVFVMITMSIESARRCYDVLIEKPAISNPANPIMNVDNGLVTFKNVNFKYALTAEKNTLENVNLNIKSGQFVGIIGATGSSKTTLISLISRLYDVTSGEVDVGGHNVKAYDLDTLRNAVAVVLQKNVLFSGTIKENLLWGDLNATDEEIRNACHIAQADEFIEQFPDKYETYIEQGGTNVSGGQKQRLCIARALLKKPKILILDDSTSAVDTKTDALIRIGLKKDIPQTTKIVVAQRTSSIESADLIIVMDDGKINDIGTHNELLARNVIYKDVYDTQNKAREAK